MKKILFFAIFLSVCRFLPAQDTIPFSNTFLCYPFSFGETASSVPNRSIGLRNFYYPPQDIHNTFYVENRVHSKHGDSTAVYGFAITTDSILPANLTVVLYLETTYRMGIQPIDSLNCSDAYYHKQMFYNYKWSNIGNRLDTSTHNSTAPCQLFFFNNPVNVPDTFLYKTTAIDQPFRISELSCYDDSSYIFVRTNGRGSYAHEYDDEHDYAGICALPIWGGIFPILSLPCPPATKPEIVESQQGSVRFAWWEGDTNLYRVAIYTYPDTTLLYLSDTLVDNSFHINDSLMTVLNLSEGRYYIRLQRACNYMDSPFSTLLWSPWSDTRMFYYVPAPAADINLSANHFPLFSLSPNPASDVVTLECYGGNAEAEPYRVDIIDMEGRLMGHYETRNSKFDIDVSSLMPGTYLLRITTPAGPTTKKLLIQ